jgi:hypothetical protein
VQARSAATGLNERDVRRPAIAALQGEPVMIRFACSHCNTALEASEEHSGESIRCSRCGELQLVPGLLPVALGARPEPWGVSARRLTPPLRRAASPSLLLVALILFTLPWTEVRCNGPGASGETHVLVEQSGLQAACGKYSLNASLRDLAPDRDKELRARISESKDADTWSGWMVLYGVLLVSGLVCGVLLRRSGLRRAVLVGCSAAAALVLAHQVRIGFPIEQGVDPVARHEIRVGQLFSVTTQGPPALEIHRTVWLWLSIAVVLGAMGAAAADAWLTLREGQWRRPGSGGKFG